MTRQKRTGCALIGLLSVICVSQVQATIVPYNFNNMPTSLVQSSGTVIVDHERVPLAVPSFGAVTTTQAFVPDLLPVSEQMYQDRHWGYWLGYSTWNGYSFLITGKSPYWGRHWGTTSTPINAAPTTQIPEPKSLILFGMAGAWMVAWTQRQRLSAKLAKIQVIA